LDRKLVHEKIWRPGLDVIEERLQRRLADLDGSGQTDETVLRLWAIEFELRRCEDAAGVGDRRFAALTPRPRL
jgi:hypothetical protein